MKLLKASIMLLIVIGVIFSLTACGDNIAGEYTLYKLEVDGTTYSPDAFGFYDTRFVLTANGSGIFYSNGGETYMSYGNGYIWETNDSDFKYFYTYENDVLSIEINGRILIFKK